MQWTEVQDAGELYYETRKTQQIYTGRISAYLLSINERMEDHLC